MPAARRSLTLILALLLATAPMWPAATSAQSASFPNKPVRIVVPFRPATADATDAIAQKLRGVGQRLSSTTVRAPAASAPTSSRMPPDGYTVVMGAVDACRQSEPLSVDAVRRSPGFHADHARRHAERAGRQLALPASVAELIAYAKANPNKLVRFRQQRSAGHPAGELFRSTPH
jgi:hypothetical protein